MHLSRKYRGRDTARSPAVAPGICWFMVFTAFHEKDYSFLRASTGSFFAARPEGMRPATNVSVTLTSTRPTAPIRGREELME